MTTGEMANGRSMTVSSSRRPGNRWRTRTTAQAIPNTVFRGTAMAAISSVSWSAWSASAVVTACHTGTMPSPKARQTTAPTGTSRIMARYPRARNRSGRRPELVGMAGPPPLEQVEAGQDQHRGRQQHHRYRGRAGHVVVLDQREHVHRGDLGAVGDVARQDHHRAELAHRPGEGQGGPGQQGRGDGGK